MSVESVNVITEVSSVVSEVPDSEVWVEESVSEVITSVAVNEVSPFEVTAVEVDVQDALERVVIDPVSEQQVLVVSNESTVDVPITTVEIVEACKQGPQGPQGPQGLPGVSGGIGLTQLNHGPLSSGDVLIIDAISVSLYRTCKWIITVADGVAGLYRTSEVLAVHNDVNPSYSHYGISGDHIAYRLSVVIDSGELQLVLANLHPNAVYVSAVRIPVVI